MAPQGLADILEEEKPLVADDLRVCDKIPNLSANGKGASPQSQGGKVVKREPDNPNPGLQSPELHPSNFIICIFANMKFENHTL